MTTWLWLVESVMRAKWAVSLRDVWWAHEIEEKDVDVQTRHVRKLTTIVMSLGLRSQCFSTDRVFDRPLFFQNMAKCYHRLPIYREILVRFWFGKSLFYSETSSSTRSMWDGFPANYPFSNFGRLLIRFSSDPLRFFLPVMFLGQQMHEGEYQNFSWSCWKDWVKKLWSHITVLKILT